VLTKEDILKIPRSRVRYKLYRIRTYEEGGMFHNANDIKEFYENQEGFTTWIEFARTWDIDKEGQHHRIIKRLMTEEEEWIAQLQELAEVMPIE